MKKTITTILTILLPFLAFGDYLELPSGARAVGMSAFCGISDGANSMFWNPGGLGLMKGGELSAGNVNLWPTDIRHTTLAGAWPTPFGTFALGAKNLDLGDFELRDTQGTITDSSCGRVDNSLLLSYGVKIPHINVCCGMTGRLIMMSAQAPLSEARGSGFDIGITKRFMLQRDWASFGFSVTNVLNAKMKDSDDVSQGIYVRNMRLGVAYCLREVFTIALDMDRQKNAPGAMNRVLAGFEYRMHPLFCIRGGLHKELSEGEAVALTGGFTFSLKGFSTHYAYTSLAALKSLHHYSLSYQFTGASPARDSIRIAIDLYDQAEYQSAADLFGRLSQYSETRDVALSYIRKCHAIDSALTEIKQHSQDNDFARALEGTDMFAGSFKGESGTETTLFSLYYEISKKCIETGDCPLARQACEKAATLKSNTDIENLRAAIEKGEKALENIKRAQLFLSRYDYDQARSALEEALEMDQGNPEAARLMQELGNTEKAQVDLNKGMDLYYDAEFKKATQVLERFISGGKGNIPTAHFFAGCAYLSMNRQAKGKDCFLKTLKLNPDFQPPETISPKILKVFEQLR
jgi:tetratricopeptide (TPR) repeat protein